MSGPGWLARVRVVLVRTRAPGNLGAAARAMACGGLDRLVLVDPRASDGPAARSMAVRAGHVLDRAERAPDLRAALAQTRWAVGTSTRALEGQRAILPRAFAAEARAVAAAGDVAIVFGDEESGLANHELALCHAVSRIPAGPAQPSLNLAAAVQVYAYELGLAALDDSPVAPRDLAAEEDHAAIERALREVLRSSRFADPDRPGRGVLELSQTLRRAGLTAAEARLWQAALLRAAHSLGKGWDYEREP